MQEERQFVLIFDADNTLWDTNAIFLAAQTAMLKPFERAGYFREASNEIRTLREIDKLLMRVFKYHEYDFQYLVKALGFYYINSCSVEESVERTLSEGISDIDTENKLFSEAFSSYKDTLKLVPPLIPHASGVLAVLRDHKTTNINLVTVLFSEGSPERLEQIIETYGFRENGFFNEVVIGPKSKEAFRDASTLGKKHLKQLSFCEVKTVVVGDSLKRDIIPANEAGFITVYVPGNFQGKETAQNQLEQPSFELESISQLPSVLKQLEIQLEASL